jgi:serine/threonine protein kinase
MLCYSVYCCTQTISVLTDSSSRANIVYYCAPTLHTQPYSYKSDIWALGCILYEMCCLKHAFKANNLLGIVFKIVAQQAPPVPPPHSRELAALVERMLTKDAATRPSIAEVLATPLLRTHMQVSTSEILNTPCRCFSQLVQQFKLVNSACSTGRTSVSTARIARQRVHNYCSAQLMQTSVCVCCTAVYPVTLCRACCDQLVVKW